MNLFLNIPCNASKSDLRCYDLFGNVSYWNLREVVLKLVHPYLAFFLVLISLLLVSLDFHSFRSGISTGAAMIIWFVAVANVAIIYAAVLAVSVLIHHRFKQFFVIMPLVGMFAMTISTVPIVYLSGLFSQEALTINVYLELLPKNVAFSVIFGVLFDSFASVTISMDYLKRERQNLKGKPLKKTSISVAGKVFEIDQLISISSQDHYVEITTLTNKKLYRARLADVVNQIPANSGITIHRSHWVSKNAVPEMLNLDDVKVIRLNSGVKLPIARGRVKDVRNWLETSGL